MYFIPGGAYKIGLFFYCSGINVILIWEVTNAGIPSENNTHPIYLSIDKRIQKNDWGGHK